MHTDEIWQLYHRNGEPIPGVGWDAGRDNPSSEDDEIVGVAIVFLYRKNSKGEYEFLWQRRSEAISRYPGDWDISAGGHINLGESVIEAAVRESREEIGAEINPDELEFAVMRPFNKNRFAWIYCVDWTDKPENFHFDDMEVSEVRWVPWSETDEFRAHFAKKPLKEDHLTFAGLGEWMKMHGDN